MESIWYVGCVDQLNLPSLLGAGVLCRRIAGIVEAYAQNVELGSRVR